MAKKTFLVDIDLSLNQLLQHVLERISSDPAGAAGRIYFNTSTNKPYYHNGTNWVEFGTTISSGMNFIGPYNASANTPDLDGNTDHSAIKKGDTYVISTAGTFFTENVQVGDMIISKQDNPTLLSHWVTVNKNIPDIVQATETVQGLIELATQAEVNAGTDSERAVTPATLKNNLANSGFTKKHATTIGDGVNTDYWITHELGTTDISVTVLNSTNEVVECYVLVEDTETVQIQFNNVPYVNEYRVILIG